MGKSEIKIRVVIETLGGIPHRSSLSAVLTDKRIESPWLNGSAAQSAAAILRDRIHAEHKGVSVRMQTITRLFGE